MSYGIKDGPKTSITINVPPRVLVGIDAMAKAVGVTRTAYARALFEAAYSARCQPTGDCGLDGFVAATVMMSHAGAARDVIAESLGVSRATVDRILKAWEARNG